MSALRVMTALSTILPTGTPIAQVVIQKGIKTIGVSGSPAFPALILNAPDGVRVRVGIGAPGPYQWTHRIHCLYLDRWESGTRALEQVLADADIALDAMIGNVSVNELLTVGGIDNCFESCDRVEKHLDGVPTDIGLGFPVVSGYVVIEVKDFYENWSPG